MQDLLAEQIDFMIEPSSNFKSLLGAGSVKPFAITGKARLKVSPNIPTADEAGLPGFMASLWYGLWVPKDTPKDIIARLNAAMVQVLAEPAGAAALCGTRHRDFSADRQNAGIAARVPEGGSRALVADHQGREYQGGVRAGPYPRHCEERQRRSNPESRPRLWIASRSLSSGARSRDPLARNDRCAYTFSSFCKHRFTRTCAGISVSGKLDFQLVKATSPT